MGGMCNMYIIFVIGIESLRSLKYFQILKTVMLVYLSATHFIFF